MLTLSRKVCQWCLFAALASPRLVAQSPPGLATWVDACEVADRDLTGLVEADAAMIAQGFLVPNLDGTYHLTRQPFDHVPELGPEYRLCSGSKFYGESRPDGFPAGRSAVLVGPDLLLSANHAFSPDVVPGHDVVFGLHGQGGPGEECSPPDFDHVPAANVYRAIEIVAHGGAAQDFILLRLDRPVTGRQPVRVRRSGLGHAGERTTVVGHPAMLQTKLDLAGTYEGESSLGEPLIQGVHTLVGSSGSMIYNRDAQLLESVVRTLACANYRVAAGDDCFELYSECTYGPYALGHPVQDFASHIPPFELLVDPLDDVVHVAAESAPLPNPITSLTVAAPETAAGPILYRVEPPAVAPINEPSLVIQVAVPLEGSLDPGKSFEIVATADANGVKCGSFERTFVVQDQTHGFVDTLRHVFEIGLAEIVVAPANELVVADLAPPFAATATYTVRNVRPTAATVVVAANRDWITLNGIAAPAAGVGPSLGLALAPAGQPGDEATVVVGLGGFANSLALGVEHVGSVAFNNTTGTCDDLGSTSRTVRFTPGSGEFTSGGLESIPIPDGEPGGLERKLSVPENFCIADVDVRIRTFGLNANHLTVDLVAPDGASVRLWDHHGLADTDIRRAFDDATAPAPTGQQLSTFNGRPGEGEWALRVVDDLPGGANTLGSWTLFLRSSGTPPCGGGEDE